MKKIIILQPLVPHYRIEFFKKVALFFDIKILTGRHDSSFQIKRAAFIKEVKNFSFGNVEFFFVFRELMKFRPVIVVTYGEVKQLTNVLLFLLKPLFGYKLIIWAHGFKHKKMDFINRIRLLQMKLSDGVLFYTETCKQDAERRFFLEKSFYLNNSMELGKNDLSHILKCKSSLKDKYNIKTKINGIFISRFRKIKAPELLLEIMLKIHQNNKDFGFIVIGEGDSKPDFSKYDFIYDFGRVYDESTKKDLFGMADFSLMPRWVGLSVVEGFSYGLPMFTLSDDVENIRHSVEFYYLKNNYNGIIAGSKNELIEKISMLDCQNIERMGKNAYEYVTNNLSLENMVANFVTSINQIR